jgi:hypothetical protein
VGGTARAARPTDANSVKGRPVRVLLDASAIIAFTRGSIDVGEILAEVNDEDAAAGLPILCLVEASRAVSDTDRLDLLVAHPATAVLVPGPTIGRLWR